MINNTIQDLDKEVSALRKFIDILTSEQKALLDNAFEQLIPLSETKTQAAGELMEIINLRRNSLLTNGTDNMESWLAKHAPAGQALWNEIRKLAEQAQNINTINGELINSRLRHNQQALSVLHNASKNAAGLYGPDGQTNLSSSGRHLGSV